MHIGINTLGMQIGNTGGLQTYTEELIRALAKVDQVNRYTIFVYKDAGEHYKVNNPNFKYVYCNVSQNWRRWSLIWRNSFFYSVVKKSKVDLLHSPANLASLFLPVPSVLTLHDTIPFQKIYMDIRPFYRHIDMAVIRRSVNQSRAIITVSQSSKLDIVNHLKISPSQVEVIYHGMPSFPSKTSLSERCAKPYILWAGRTSAHKNLMRLIRAYDILVRTKNIKHDLYLVGMRGYRHNNLIKEIERLGLKGRILFLGFHECSQLKTFYENASLFVFPSLVEGFGFPIVEAMSCETPVVTSNRGAMKEVAGDAAYLVDPENVEDIARGMWEVISSLDLQEQLISKGQERVKQFSWEKCAIQTLNVYSAICKN